MTGDRFCIIKQSIKFSCVFVVLVIIIQFSAEPKKDPPTEKSSQHKDIELKFCAISNSVQNLSLFKTWMPISFPDPNNGNFNDKNTHHEDWWQWKYESPNECTLSAATRKQKDHCSLSIASFFVTWLNKLPDQAIPIRVTLFYFLHKIAIP